MLWYAQSDLSFPLPFVGYCLDGESLDMVCRQIRVEAILYTLVRGKCRVMTATKRDLQLPHTHVTISIQ